MSDILTVPEKNKLSYLEGIITRGKKAFVEVGSALAQIQTQKLYKSTHNSFEAYCREKWGWAKAHAYRLIAAAEVVKASPIGDKIITESQAREVAKVEPGQRSEVIEIAATVAAVENREMTAADIRDAGRLRKIPVPQVKINRDAPKKKKLAQEFQDPNVARDETGMVVPDHLLPIWNRRHEYDELLVQVRHLVGIFKSLQESDDPLWARLERQATFSNLSMALCYLKNGRPHAVCATCLGKQPDKCGNCHSIGILSSQDWGLVPEENRELRKKFIASQTGAQT